MKLRKSYFGWLLTGLLSWTSCQNNIETEVITNDFLPEGVFPVNLADLPWHQTNDKDNIKESRITEDRSGIHSYWSNGDRIGIRISGGGNDDATIATLSDNGQLEHPPLFWRTMSNSIVNAWYPTQEGAISLKDQQRGLVYILKADPIECNYLSGPIHLEFRHQLAKVKVVVTGGFSWLRSSKLAIWGYSSCLNQNGNFSEGNESDYIEMRAIRSRQRVFEALVYPRAYKKGEKALRITFWSYQKFFKLKKDVNLKAGHVYTLGLDAKFFQ